MKRVRRTSSKLFAISVQGQTLLALPQLAVPRGSQLNIIKKAVTVRQLRISVTNNAWSACCQQRAGLQAAATLAIGDYEGGGLQVQDPDTGVKTIIADALLALADRPALAPPDPLTR